MHSIVGHDGEPHLCVRFAMQLQSQLYPKVKLIVGAESKLVTIRS